MPTARAAADRGEQRSGRPLGQTLAVMFVIAIPAIVIPTLVLNVYAANISALEGLPSYTHVEQIIVDLKSAIKAKVARTPDVTNGNITASSHEEAQKAIFGVSWESLQDHSKKQNDSNSKTISTLPQSHGDQMRMLENRTSHAVVSVTPNSSMFPPHQSGSSCNVNGRLYWLHIPKCGTSWGRVLMSCVCPKMPADRLPAQAQTAKMAARKNQKLKEGWLMQWVGYGLLSKYSCANRFAKPVGGHTPLIKEVRVKTDVLMTTFRHPNRRLASAYADKLHSNGMDVSKMHHMRKTVKTLDQFANYKGISSCQVKMLIGEHCAAEHHPTDEEIRRAIMLATSEEDCWFGLTDYWDHSVWLFHKKFGGQPLHSVFANTRPSRNPAKAELWETLPADVDPVDLQLWKSVVPVFVARLRHYGMPDSMIPDSLLAMTRR